jgi:hypothetical protein
MNIRKLIKEELSKVNLNDNFWEWFDGSKVLNDRGEPMICYHGTDESDIKSFDLSKVGYSSGNYGHYGYGFYFSSEKSEAKIYGPFLYECYIRS